MQAFFGKKIDENHLDLLKQTVLVIKVKDGWFNLPKQKEVT
jgi:hypothetical protein